MSSVVSVPPCSIHSSLPALEVVVKNRRSPARVELASLAKLTADAPSIDSLRIEASRDLITSLPPVTPTFTALPAKSVASAALMVLCSWPASAPSGSPSAPLPALDAPLSVTA